MSAEQVLSGVGNESTTAQLMKQVYCEMKNGSTIMIILKGHDDNVTGQALGCCSFDESLGRSPSCDRTLQAPMIDSSPAAGDGAETCSSSDNEVTDEDSNGCPSLKFLSYFTLVNMGSRQTAGGDFQQLSRDSLPDIEVVFSSADQVGTIDTIHTFGNMVVPIETSEHAVNTRKEHTEVRRLEGIEHGTVKPKRSRSAWKRTKRFFRRLLCCGA